VGPVALDASVAIGFLEGTDPHHARAVEMLRECAEAPLSMSASAYSECLVKPVAAGLGDEVDRFVEGLRIEIVPLDREVGRRAAELRAAHDSLRLPDAVVLASAQLRGARLLTFDGRLAQLRP
jgi:predicted nucleic acid-binding protein